MFGKILCRIGIHHLDRTRWLKEIWNRNIFETNICERCNKEIYKYNDKIIKCKSILKKLG